MDKPSFDPYSHAMHDDPYPHYKALREHDPVHFVANRGFWLLTKWDDVHQALRDFRTFSSRYGGALESDPSALQQHPMIISMDPPKHSHLRRVVSGLMTPERIGAFEESIRRRTRELVTPYLSAGRMDVIADFGCLLPMAVISDMIGIPPQDQDTLRRWVDGMIYRDDDQDEIDERNAAAYQNVAGYFDDHASRYAEGELGDNILGAICHAEKAGAMTHEEVIGFLILLSIAGNETTTKLIGNMIFRLWQHPEQRAMVLEDPSLIPKAVEETLRFDGSSQIIGRVVEKDVRIRGKTLKAGERVGLCLISANRDEERFPDAERFDITRGRRDHMAFGFGAHACLGAALARLEARVALEEILPNVGEYDIDIAAAKRTHNPNVRGYTHLPLSFEPIG